MSNSANNRGLYFLMLLLLTANIITLILLWTNKKSEHELNRMPPPEGNQVFEFLTHELKLDSEQQVIYRKLRDEHRAGVKPLQDSIRNSKDRFFNLLPEKNVSDTVIYNSSKQIGELQQQIEIITFKHFQKLRAICHNEQQEKFDKIIKDVLRNMAGPKGPPHPQHGKPDGPESARPPE